MERVERIAVVGTVGAGKSMYARKLATALQVPVLKKDEMLRDGDASPAHRAAVDAATSGARWVFDGTPFYVEDIVYRRADTIIVLDYSRLTCVWRALRRSVRLMVTRRRRDSHYAPVRGWLNREHAIRWAWSTQPERRQRFGKLAAEALLTETRVVRFRCPRQAEAWLRSQSER